jgi:hypothetical protein
VNLFRKVLPSEKLVVYWSFRFMPLEKRAGVTLSPIAPSVEQQLGVAKMTLRLGIDVENFYTDGSLCPRACIVMAGVHLFVARQWSTCCERISRGNSNSAPAGSSSRT